MANPGYKLEGVNFWSQDIGGQGNSPGNGPSNVPGNVQVPYESLYTLLAGEKLPNSQPNGYLDTGTQANTPTLLHAISANAVNAGLVLSGTGTPGTIGDSRLCKVIILKNAGPATLTIVGFGGEDGTPRSVVLTGSTTADTTYDWGAGWVNSAAAMTLTASVADVILVSTRPAG